ncbi:MAG: tRNA lysidine(34) synthetase TilS [Allosphingosinicella sp.]
MAAAPPPELVSRFRRDLERLAGSDRDAMGLAVSGGPDSLALLLLAQAAFPGRVSAATVDHGLRSESGAEAAYVSRICEGLHVPHQTLPATVVETGEGLQAAARKARYDALGRWMEAEGIGLLLTAHHAEDQAETLLMRLNRGSGVGGLAGIRPLAFVPGYSLALCRPLLGWRRHELAAVVEGAGIEAVHDPSNEDDRFDRVRIRARLHEAPWLDVDALARSAELLARADVALEWISKRLYAERVAEAPGLLRLRPEELPDELLRRLVLRCLQALEPEAGPRGDALEALIAALEQGGTATLAGVKASGGEIWRFERAPPRRR